MWSVLVVVVIILGMVTGEFAPAWVPLFLTVLLALSVLTSYVAKSASRSLFGSRDNGGGGSKEISFHLFVFIGIFFLSMWMTFFLS